jgi:hypothetical protein
VTESQQLADTLVKRAEEILKRAKADLQRLHGSGLSHLTLDLEKEIRMVETYANELKAIPHDFHFELHQIHTIEEQLLKHENLLAELIATIEWHNDSEPRDLHVLLSRAEKLVEEAKYELSKLHGRFLHEHLVQEMEYEIQRLQELIHELRAHPSSHLDADHGRQVETRLADHVRRLTEILRRLEESR